MYKNALRYLMAVSSGILSLVSVSCVNEEYDLSKDIDMEMTVLRNTSVPVGSAGRISVDEFLALDENESLISKDQNGNLYFRFAQDDPEFHSVSVPSWTFHADEKSNTVESQVPEFYIPYDNTPESENAWILAETPVDIPVIKFDIILDQEDIPAEVHDIRYASVNGELVATVRYRSSQNKVKMIWLDEGASFSFPDWLVLGQMPDGLIYDGEHVYTSHSLMIDMEEHPIHIPIVGIDFTKLPEGQGVVEPGILHVEAHVEFMGKVHLDRDQIVEGGYFAPVFTATMELSELHINNVEVMVLPELDIESSSVEIDDVPDFLRGENVCLDLADFWLNMNIRNTSPLNGHFNAVIVTQKDGADIAEIPFGPVVIPAASEVGYAFSEKGEGAADGYTDVKVDNLGMLLESVPETISFKDIDMQFEEEFVTLTPGEAFEFVYEYELLAPLAFGNAFRFEYSTDWTDMDLDLTDLNVKSATMSINAVSSMPLDIILTVEAIDAEGNKLTDINVAVQGTGKIKAGSLDAPSHSPIVLAISSVEPIAFDGLRLNVVASCSDAAYVGIPLNVNQGLEFQDIILNLPEGITAEADELF
ncbi:MAG: hypothetical protein E7117_04990 [Bacteroidales bacterium]|nr:hypothetical protein [Bacteroidales bacterium]